MEAMGTRTVSPVNSARVALARAVRIAGSAVAGLIVAGILLVVLDANPRNEFVELVTDAARWLTDPFHGVFDPESRDAGVAANWGLAAAVYFAVSRVLVRLLAR
jgi:hypothetical protein